MTVQTRLLAAAALPVLLSACAPTLGPPPPTPAAAPYVEPFRAADFAWAQGARNRVHYYYERLCVFGNIAPTQ